MPWENVLHCDGKGIAKPDLSLYRDMLDNQFAGQEVWFGASHAWDSAGSRQAGYVKPFGGYDDVADEK